MTDILPSKAIYEATRGCADRPEGWQLIQLTKGFFAAVDDEDFDRINAVRWYATQGGRYAVRCEYAVVPGRGYTMIRTVPMPHEIITVPPGYVVDHIDHNGLNNRRANLRVCTPKQNTCNRRSSSAVGFRGVRRSGNRFRADIKSEGRSMHLGHFVTVNEAAIAYDRAAARLFGEFARLNFPDHMDTRS